MSAPGGGRYMALFAAETVAAAILGSIVVPVYRAAVAAPGSYAPKAANIAWATAAMIVMQASYWIGRRLHPQLPNLHHAVLGHILLFAGRMSFVLATSIFAFVFVTGRLESRLALPGYAMTLVGLFCWFCYTQDLQRLGHALMGPDR